MMLSRKGGRRSLVMVLACLLAGPSWTAAAAAAAAKEVVLEVKESSLGGHKAGLGVFLSSPAGVAKGTVLTTYGSLDVEAARLAGTVAEWYTHAIPDQPGWVRSGAIWSRPTPALVRGADEEQPLGHLINDAAAFGQDASSANTGPEELKHMISEYLVASAKGANVEVLGFKEGWAVVATRDLQAGEELFYSYGPNYWIYAMGRVNGEGDPLLRLLAFMTTCDLTPESCPSGALVFDKEGRTILSTTGKAPDEEYSQRLVTGYLGMSEESELQELGILWGGSYAKVLEQLIDRVLDGPIIEEEEEDQEGSKDIGQEQEGLVSEA